mmetsp:Transcript_33810/g.54860  ORF Transcript_33810/g.54860 Transcript_33810/m.54860 type:complete len:556 (-) Transcript_33810:243-1910(-)
MAVEGRNFRQTRVGRALSKRQRSKAKARVMNRLCSCYFCTLLTIYAIFVSALVIPLAFEESSSSSSTTTSSSSSSLAIQNPKECSESDKKIHIIFSTGCNLFQQWQAEVLLNSAKRVGQCGRITRIVSGCEEREDEGGSTGQRWITHQGGKTDQLVPTQDLIKSTNQNLNVHITPMLPESKEFPWWNKPYSIAHFAENGDLRDDEVVMILDPDEFFVHALTQSKGTPLTHVLAHGRTLDMIKEANDGVSSDIATPGHPVAQMYGLGDRWLTLFDREKICGIDSPCTKVSSEEAWTHYSVGPPYILHATDFKKVAPLWLKMMKPVYEADRGDMQADMYAYIMAAAHYNLKHTRLEHFMVSDVGAAELEAWPWVEKIDSMSCQDPTINYPASSFPPFNSAQNSPLIPALIHAAQHYKAVYPKTGETWNFHKGHIPGQILDCEQPLVVSPPDDLFNVQTNNRDKRSAFMVCWMTYTINRAVLEYRKQFCTKKHLPEEKQEPKGGIVGIEQGGGGAGGGGVSEYYNSAKCIRLVVFRHQVVPPCNNANPDCYPLANRVC